MNATIAAPLPDAPAPVNPFKDRSVGLVIFGILTILLGCLAGLVAVMVLVQMAAMPAATQAPASSMLIGVVLYGGLAVILIWLGIGSTMACRWARALTLIFSWVWLVMGLVCIVSMAVVMPAMLAGIAKAQPHGAPVPPAVAVMAGMFFFLGIFFILLPAIWTFFYSSRHVKATCEAKNPTPGWTDACPLPVLAVCLWQVVAAPSMLLMPVVAHGMIPFFGMFLTGLPGILIYVVLAGVMAYAGWSMYHLQTRGWWLLLAILGLFAVSSFITYGRHDISEIYQAMGYTQAQMDALGQTGILGGGYMRWLTVASMLPIIIYLICIKRYLRPQAGHALD